jgi:hypothetical protein
LYKIIFEFYPHIFYIVYFNVISSTPLFPNSRTECFTVLGKLNFTMVVRF